MQISSMIHNVPKDVLLRYASKVERLIATDIPPEEHGVPLTDDQIALRRLWREFSRVDFSSLNIIGRDGTPLRMGEALSSNETAMLSPVPSIPMSSDDLAVMQRNQASIHSMKMTMLSSWMKQVEILRKYNNARNTNSFGGIY